MIQKKQIVQFTVQNRTDCGIDVPIYELNVFSINATTKYTWDITTETITCGYGTIIIDGATYSLSWDGTLLGLLTALNALNFGYFCSETVGSNTYLVTFDDTNVYGVIDLCFAITTSTTTTTTAAPTTTTTTTTSTTTAAPTTTTTTTTTTVNYVTFTLAQSFISGAQACLDYPTVNTTQYYATLGSTLTTGTIIYTDTALTTPAANAFYSNGVDYWNTGAGSGNLQNQTSCGFTTTTTTTTTTTIAPTTTTTTTTTTAAPTTTTTTTSTTTAAPLLRTFRVNNTSLSNSIELDVQVDSVQKISPTVIPANSVLTLTPQVDCAGFTNVTLEYQLVSGYTPTSASFSNGSGTYTGTIAGGFITFTGVDLTANTFQDLTVNP